MRQIEPLSKSTKYLTMKKLIKFVLRNVPRKYIQKVVHIFTPIMGLMYSGRGVECPICGARYRKFMPYGYVHSRENALCPRCLSLERHRLMWLYLCNETDLFEREISLLHVAPERCFIKRLEAVKSIDYITADLESPLARLKMDIQDIPLDNESVDVIFCNHILEHVENDRKALSEMFRVMRPGGWGILLSPVNYSRETTYENAQITDPQEREKHFGQKDHVRDYGRDYPARLTEAGFDVSEIDYVKYFDAEDVAKLALRSEIIYLVKKR